MFQQSIFQLASSKLETLRTKKAETSNRLKDLHDRMEVLTVELNLEIKNLLNGIEIIVRSVYQDEIENIAVLVSGFEAPFYNDPAVLNLYKQHLVRCVCIQIRITCIPKYKEINRIISILIIFIQSFKVTKNFMSTKTKNSS